MSLWKSSALLAATALSLTLEDDLSRKGRMERSCSSKPRPSILRATSKEWDAANRFSSIISWEEEGKRVPIFSRAYSVWANPASLEISRE